MLDKIKELTGQFFDGKTSAVIIGAGTSFATMTVNERLSCVAASITIFIGLLKILEMFTGKKISEILKRK